MDHHSPTRSSERAIGQGMAPKLVRCMAGIWHDGLHFARQWRGQTRLYCPDRAIGERFMPPSFRRLPKMLPVTQDLTRDVAHRQAIYQHRASGDVGDLAGIF